MEPYMYDPKREARYAAAGATLRLVDRKESKTADKLPQLPLQPQ